MAVVSKGADLAIVYKLVDAIATPFNKTEAYNLGLIDEEGKKLKKAKTKEEKAALTYLDRFVFNVKRLMAKAGMKSKMASFASAMFLLREGQEIEYTDIQLLEGIRCNMKDVKEIMEAAPTNHTGSNVVGTGDDQVTWKKHKLRLGGKTESRKIMGRQINGATFIKRMARAASLREKALKASADARAKSALKEKKVFVPTKDELHWLNANVNMSPKTTAIVKGAMKNPQKLTKIQVLQLNDLMDLVRKTNPGTKIG